MFLRVTAKESAKAFTHVLVWKGAELWKNVWHFPLLFISKILKTRLYQSYALWVLGVMTEGLELLSQQGQASFSDSGN